MADSTTSKAIEELRASLQDKLEELHRRANQATRVLAPSTYWNDPVVRFGIGVAIGLAIGTRGKPRDGDGLLYSLVRAGLTATTTALISRAIASAGEPLAAASETALAKPDEP
jgi:hypothetical protein